MQPASDSLYWYLMLSLKTLEHPVLPRPDHRCCTSTPSLSTKMPKQKTKSSTRRKRSGTDGVVSHERSWSELPEEILHLFSKKVPDISNFICFRAVCKRWQLSAPVTDRPPQLPWLLERHQDLENPIMRFYCLSSDKVHTIIFRFLSC